VNVAIAVGCAAVMVTAAKAMYSLQEWLERVDYQRHFED
jgi:hypothetical protein